MTTEEAELLQCFSRNDAQELGIGHNLPVRDARGAGATEIPRNYDLRGDFHPETGVPFDSEGYPVFESEFDTKMTWELIGSGVSSDTQMRYATQKLGIAICEDPGLAEKFSFEQLWHIREGSPQIPGYTWHHSQDGVTLQLVDRVVHALTGHTGP